MHGIDEPDELAYWRERARQAERERDALVTRRDELLATIVKLTRDLPYPEEANAANVLIAEVGTLRAQLAKVTKERDEALREAERLRHDTAIEGDFVCPNELAATNAAQETAEQIAAWLDGLALDLNRTIDQDHDSVAGDVACIADDIRSGAWRTK